MPARLTEIPRRHLEDLKRKGMSIDDEASAAHALEFISYYRLQTYWEEFLQPQEFLVDRKMAPDGKEERYRKGTRFEDGVALYRFDRDLRLIVLDAVERVEVALRALWERQVSSHGWFAYHSKPDIYRHQQGLRNDIAQLTREYQDYLDSEDLALAQKKWAENPQNGLPVAWVAAEIMSFGRLMRWIKRLKKPDQREIASCFSVSADELLNIGFHLSHVRNVCAHFNPLWNRELGLPFIHGLPSIIQKSMAVGNTKFKLHNTLVLLSHLLSIIKAGEGQQWRKRIIDLIDREPLKPACLDDSPDDWIPDCMGFPKNWRQLPVWHLAAASLDAAAPE